MSEVKRFKPVINDKPYKPYAHCEESEDGIYVRLGDYAELKAQRDALAAEIDRQEDWEDAVIDALESAGIIRKDVTFTRSLLIELLKQNLKSDAYLNSVRAEGSFEASAAISRAVTCFKEQHKGAVMECADIAREIGIGIAAAQLRAGEPS